MEDVKRRGIVAYALSFLFNQPYLLLSLTALFWSGNAIVGRAAIEQGMPPIGLSFWRWFLAFLIVLPFAWRHLRIEWRSMLDTWPVMLGLGTLGGASFNLCMYIGLQTTQAINAGLLQAFIPVTILMLAIPILGERTSVRQVSGMVVAFAGVLAIIFQGDIARLLDLSFTRGDVWIVAGVVLNAFYSIVLKWKPKVHPLSLLAGIFGVSSMALLPLYLVETMNGRPVPLTEVSLGAILYVALFPAVAAYFCYNRGIELLGPARAGVAIYLVPMMVSLLAVGLLGEPFHLYHAIGMALILGGLAFAEARRGGGK
ncbi:EamA family transporter [Parvibaculum sedimenti]|uniref:EamA family transporter n=1 Tax=Parvibaculum sedimenti TaxID=2608632 RepID=A0A6N6VMB7_9HYPH|nr:DMT family transporter [Parvibaculum sedimenti]KAB7740162.1 EamA family transporter [Parvibaculum sedimenti]